MDWPVILGKILGNGAAICVWTFILQFITRKVAGFKPAYGMTFLALVISSLSGFALAFFATIGLKANDGGPTAIENLLALVICFFIEATVYHFMLKSPDGRSLGYGRACIVSLVRTILSGLVGLARMMILG